MARPTTKNDLLIAAQEGYDKLMSMINALPIEQQEGTFTFADRDKNIRDVLAHLHEWHLMMLHWYEVGMSGQMPVTPAQGYTWRTTPELNYEIWKKYQGTDLATIKTLLAETHEKEMVIINGHTNEELFSKNVYAWTKTTTLGAYFVSSTSSHYDWAMKKIRKYIKELKNK